MALFKFRKGGDASPSSPAQPETVEALRRRARHRLIGAAVLVLLGIIGFPLLFDTQPRPVAVDIPIEIPDRNKAKPLAPPATAATAAQPKPADASAAAKADAAKADAAKAEAAKIEAAKAEAAKAEAAKLEAAKSDAGKAAAAKADAKPRPEAAQAKAEQPARPSPPADAARAQALLEGKTVQAGSADATEGRFVVQVGAFADVGKARETRLKVEKAGLKTYTHVAETKEGKRIRVRVGPFATRGEADKAAGKIKELELPASVLTL
jgi:DedD protein